MMAEHSLSQRRACKLLEVDRTSYRYEPQPDRNVELREKLIELAKQNRVTATAVCWRCSGAAAGG